QVGRDEASLLFADVAEQLSSMPGHTRIRSTRPVRSPETTSAMASESTSPDDDRSHVDATVSPPPRPSPPSVSTQETGGSSDIGDSTATPPVQEVPENGMTASTIRAITDDDRPIPVWQVADHEKESEGPQLHDGPPGPPRFPHELDDSLAKKVDNERVASRAFENRLQHEVVGPREQAAQETGDSTVGDCTAAPILQEEVTQGGTTASTIRSMNDDDPPVPLLQVADHENETEGPQLHDGPPGPQYSLSEFDDSLAKSIENEFEQHSSNHPCDNSSTVHSTTGAPVANAAAEGPPMGGGVEEGRASSGGSTPLTSPLTEAATEAVGLHSALSERSTFVAEAWVEYPEVMPGRGIVYEAETIEPQMPIVLPFYRRKGLACFLVAMFLLAVGIATAMQLFNKSDRSNDGEELTVTDSPKSSNSPTASNIPIKKQAGYPTTAQAYQGKLQAPDGAAFDEFGGSVAIYGDTIVVGAEEDDDNGMRSGSAYVFVWSGKEWTHQAKLLAPDGAAYDFFGHSVAIYRDSIVVSAYWDGDNGSISGSAHVFFRSEDGEGWTHEAKLLAPDGAADDRFGNSVAIHGGTIVVGVTGDDDNGSAHVFVQSEKEWTHQAKLLAPDGAHSDSFGYSTAIYGDTIVVGARWDDANQYNSGSAHVFVRSGKEWIHQAKLLAPNGAAFDYFGNSVSIYEDTIVVGADGRGSAHVFVRSGEEWTHKAKLLAPDGAWFGGSVAIYGDVIVVSGSGSAHVFVRSGGEWTHETKLLAPDGAVDDKFGCSVSIYVDTLVVGANEDDNNKGSNSGSAYIFPVV
ncbi:hypothetical protein THAOC_00955, partial [Thalassiosira oceanica]